MRLYIGLVHYPVYNKNHQRIASAITIMDLHDISRLAKTYDARKFFVITPLVDQQTLAERVRRHWTEGYGSRYNEDRKEAFDLIAVVPSLDQAVNDIAALEGEVPLLIATGASSREKHSISFEQARSFIRAEKALMLMLGTAWGLDKEVLREADYVLAPIAGRKDYNHLSVRTAAAIMLDRLTREGLPGSKEDASSQEVTGGIHEHN